MTIKKDTVEIPEVLEFLVAEEELQNFRELHAQVFEEYAKYVERRNQKRGAADKAVRTQGVSCGPWDRYQEVTKWDWKIVYDMEGREKFVQGGGVLSTTTTYSGNKARADASVSAGIWSKDTVEAARKVEGRYHSPKDIDV